MIEDSQVVTHKDGKVKVTFDEHADQAIKVAEPSQIFTFGYGQTHPLTGESLADCYVRVAGDSATSRARMLASPFGRNWSMQYATPERAGVERYGLREVDLPGRAFLETLDHDQAMRHAEDHGHLNV